MSVLSGGCFIAGLGLALGWLFFALAHRHDPPPPAVSKTCPHCAELVKIAASVCKHCGRNI